MSLIEVAISTLLVGLMLVGALKCCGSLVVGRTASGDRAIAWQLAQQLMTEICTQAYSDEGDSPEVVVMGVGGNRSHFDKVDDYHLWWSTPPENRLGIPIQGRNGWARAVTVGFVDPADPSQPVDEDTGLKRIVVVVLKNGHPIVQHSALRSEKVEP